MLWFIWVTLVRSEKILPLGLKDLLVASWSWSEIRFTVNVPVSGFLDVRPSPVLDF